jgi:thymidine kinase
MRCGNLAQFSHRTVADEKLVMLGETDTYEPLCRACYIEATKSQKTNK